MRPRERREAGEQDLFRLRLDQIIDMKYALVKLSRAIDWRVLEERFGKATMSCRSREFKRRAAVEPVIGHLRAEHRMGCNHLAHRAGDAINAMLAAVGYTFHILLRWLRLLLREILVAYLALFRLQTA
jgi:hypothetical protein